MGRSGADEAVLACWKKKIAADSVVAVPDVPQHVQTAPDRVMSV